MGNFAVNLKRETSRAKLKRHEHPPSPPSPVPCVACGASTLAPLPRTPPGNTGTEPLQITSTAFGGGGRGTPATPGAARTTPAAPRPGPTPSPATSAATMFAELAGVRGAATRPRSWGGGAPRVVAHDVRAVRAPTGRTEGRNGLGAGAGGRVRGIGGAGPPATGTRTTAKGAPGGGTGHHKTDLLTVLQGLVQLPQLHPCLSPGQHKGNAGGARAPGGGVPPVHGWRLVRADGGVGGLGLTGGEGVQNMARNTFSFVKCDGLCDGFSVGAAGGVPPPSPLSPPSRGPCNAVRARPPPPLPVRR